MRLRSNLPYMAYKVASPPPAQRSGARLTFTFARNLELLTLNGNLLRTEEKAVPACKSPDSISQFLGMTLRNILTGSGIRHEDLSFLPEKRNPDNNDQNLVFSFETREDLPNYLKNLRALHTLYQKFCALVSNADGTNRTANPKNFAYRLLPEWSANEKEKTILQLERLLSSGTPTDYETFKKFLKHCWLELPWEDKNSPFILGNEIIDWLARKKGSESEAEKVANSLKPNRQEHSGF
jgi:hypothetical protein